MNRKPIIPKPSKGYSQPNAVLKEPLQGFSRHNPWRVSIQLLLLFISVSFFSFIVAISQPDQLVQKLEDYLGYYTPEKVYLHTDKPYYAAGDTIWFAAYLTHGVSHMATAPSKIVYVELVNQEKEVLARRDIGIELGTGAAEFALADTLARGNYLLRGYTSFMRNFDQGYFFNKEIRIEGLSYEGDIRQSAQASANGQGGSLSKLVSVQFFPEGGDLVSGLWSTVGIKVTSPDGEGVKVTGEVVDANGAKLGDIATGFEGMGKFRLHPEKGKSYKAVLHFGQETIEKPLPEARGDGFVLTVSALGDKYVAIKVEGSGPAGTKDGFLIGHVRGAVFTTQVASGKTLEALIAKEDVPEGVVTLTWFDKEGRPQCERLVFNDRPDLEVALEVNGLQEAYGKRDLVSFNIQSELGEEPNMVMSIAITDKVKIHHDADGNNIKSYLLLDSDLRGEIVHPGHYFNEANRRRLEDLDNLLITQGWRRFTWGDIIDKKTLSTIFQLESEGFSLQGIAKDFYNQKKPLANRRITLTATSTNGDIFMQETLTDSIGTFSFNSLDFSDSTNVIFQTPKELTSSKKLKQKMESGEVNAASEIVLRPYISPADEFNMAPMNNSAQEMSAFLDEMRKIREVEMAFGQKDVTVLKNIDVKGSRITEHKRFDPTGKIYSRVDFRLDVDSISRTSQSNSMFDLLYGIPGVEVVQALDPGGLPIMHISLRKGGFGGNEPLFLVNGIPSTMETVKGISVGLIDFIDVVKSVSPIYGSRGASGIIAIYLKDGGGTESSYEARGVASFIHSGYYQAREFYSPDYNGKRESDARPDFRPTLFWKAGLITTELEPAAVEFYTSDVASEFEVRIEGITTDGRPFLKIEAFKVN